MFGVDTCDHTNDADYAADYDNKKKYFSPWIRLSVKTIEIGDGQIFRDFGYKSISPLENIPTKIKNLVAVQN